MRPFVKWIFILTFFALATSICSGQETPPIPVPVVPPTAVDPNIVTNIIRVTAELRITDPVKCSSKAESILKAKHGLTAVEAKAWLRPSGEFDSQRCLAVIILERIRVGTDGFISLASGMLPEPDPITVPQEDL